MKRTVDPKSFAPGSFEPVLTVSQKPTPTALPLDLSRDGLGQCASATLRVAYSSTGGFGGNTEWSASDIPTISKFLASLLWARNLAQQAVEVGIACKAARDLLQQMETFEPLVKLYNTYGHVVVDDKIHVQRDLQHVLAKAIVDLGNFSHPDNETGSDWTDYGMTSDELDRVTMPGLVLSDAGELSLGTASSKEPEPLPKFQLRIIQSIQSSDKDDLLKLHLMQEVMDTATEEGIQNVLLYLRGQGITPPDRGEEYVSTTDRDRLKDIFGDVTTTTRKVPNANVSKVLRRALRIANRLVYDLPAMATLRIPKYEGGARSGLAWLKDGVLYSATPISLVDATVSAAFKTARFVRRVFRSVPESDREQLAFPLVSRSVRRAYG